MLADGNLYANIFEGDGLYRIEIKPDGSAGAITKLETSRKLFLSDGLRKFGPQSLIMVEGEKVGTLDLITVSGNSAKVETVKDGFDGPVSLVQVGDVAYVLDDPLRYLFDPELSKKPGPPVQSDTSEAAGRQIAAGRHHARRSLIVSKSCVADSTWCSRVMPFSS